MGRTQWRSLVELDGKNKAFLPFLLSLSLALVLHCRPLALFSSGHPRQLASILPLPSLYLPRD